jgi:integrase
MPKRKGGRPRKAIPTLHEHKDGRAFVVVDGRQITLGKAGDPATVTAYARFVEELTASGKPGHVVRERLSVTTTKDLGNKYLAHATAHFVKRGKPTQHVYSIGRALDLMSLAGLGEIDASAFGPKSLKRYIDFLADNRDGTYKRTTVNQYAGLLVGMYRWAVSEELVEPSVYEALKTVGKIGKGRAVGSKGRVLAEPRKVQDVDPKALKATLPHLSRVVVGMVEVQRLCAMRPEEVCMMRAGDLVRADDGALEYRVRDDANKLAHHGIGRVVLIGPKAEKILAPFLKGLAADDFVFSPAVAESERLERRRAEGRVVRPEEKLRTGKLRLASTRTLRARRAPRNVGERYDTAAYRRAITRACDAAGVAHWSPNRLRHSGASAFANSADIHIAKDMLGHGDIRTTMGYVHADRLKALKAARKIA